MSSRTIDGSNPATAGAQSPTYTVFAGGASGTYTSPPGCTYIIVEMQGAGGSGRSGSSSSGDFGGGAGGYIKGKRGPASNVSYSVGIGGASQTGVNGISGGNTTFGSAVAYGGRGGEQNNCPIGGDTDTTSITTVFFNQRGQQGTTSVNTGFSGPGGSSVMANANSSFNYSVQTSQIYRDAFGYGCGGASVGGVFTSGKGGDGRLIITEYY